MLVESFRPGVMDRLGVGYEALRGAQPAARLLRDLRLRAGRPADRALRPRHQLPRARRPARADRPPRRPADPVGRPDRRPRRRRPDGGGRDPRGAARARALGRGPARRHLDDRRLAVVAGDGGRALLLRAGDRRGAASSSWPAASSATSPTRPRTADGSRSARSSRSSGTTGATASAAPDLKEKQFEHPELGGGRGGRRGVQAAHARRVDDVRRRARLLPRAGARPRRGARVRARAGARHGRRAGPARASARSSRSAFRSSSRARRPRIGRAAPALGEHTDEVLRAIGYDAERIAACARREWCERPAGRGATASLLRMRELAEAAGVSAGTIKHYLREGLLPEPVKTSRNMAYYPREFVERHEADQAASGGALPAAQGDQGGARGRRRQEDGPERLRALIELEDRVLERAFSGQDTAASASWRWNHAGTMPPARTSQEVRSRSTCPERSQPGAAVSSACSPDRMMSRVVCRRRGAPLLRAGANEPPSLMLDRYGRRTDYRPQRKPVSMQE